MQTLLQDLRYGFRMLRKAPGFTLVAIVTLALGMGANTLVFSILDTLYLRTAPVRKPNELVMSVGSHRGVSLPEFEYYRDHNHSFSALAAEYDTAHVYLQDTDDSKIVLSAIVSSNYFDLLGVRPFLGRFFVPADDQTPGLQVTILSYGLWQNKFGGDRELVGKSIKLNGVSATVIGVAPPEFHRLFSGTDDDLWMPSGAAAVAVPHCNPPGYKCGFFAGVIGRLRPDVDASSAQAELNGLNQQWESIYPDLEKSAHRLFQARGVDPRSRRAFNNLPSVLIATVAVLLLIACANLSGLLLARGMARGREIAIRLALGAGRGRIVRQLLTESAILAFLGSAAGALFLMWGSRWLANFPFAPTEGFRDFYNIGFDARVLAATMTLSAVTVFVFGLMPALRSSKPSPSEAMKQTGTSTADASWSSALLVGGQVALALVLSAGAVLMVRSLDHVLMGPGFDPRHIAIVRVSPYRLGYSPEKSAAIQTEAIRRLANLPGVEAVAFGQLMPWWESWEETVALPGEEQAAPDRMLHVHYNSIAPNYLRTLNIPLLRGREFTDLDRKGSPDVVVVNQSLASRIWPAQDAVGQTLVIGGTRCTVVGVAQDAQFSPSTDSSHMFFYMPYWQIQNNGDSRFLVRTSSDPARMLHEIKKTISNIDSNVPIGEDATMTEALLNDFGPLRLTRVILVFAGISAVILSAVGLYSVLAFVVARRTREIGIRLALGATRRHVMGMFLQQGVRLALAGGVAGGVVAILALRLLAQSLYGISATDPLTLLGVWLLLAAVCLLASYFPARRAAKVDPMVALRCE